MSQAIRDRREAAAAEAAGAAEAALDQQIKLATKEKALLDAQYALDPNNLALSQETASLNARIAQLTAQKKLQELGEELDPAGQ